MAVRWIGDAARDLGLQPLEAVELLARHQNYPMNGLLDEDRVLLLKRYAQERKGVEGSGRSRAPGNVNATQQTAKVVQQRGADPMAATSVTAVTPVTPVAPVAPVPPVTAATAPMESPKDHAEDRTVIIPPPLPHG
jgi:hypothetical protein